MRVFLSGRMSGEASYGVDTFAKAEAALQASGYEVANPFDCISRVWERHHSVPFDPEFDRCDYGDPLLKEIFLELIRELLSCDALAQLPLWYLSKGAIAETVVANLFSLEVASVEWFVDTANGR